MKPAMSGLVVDLLLEGQPVRTVSFDRPVLRIGRMRENDLALDDLAVSRFHARLHLEAGRVFLEDGGSENGSFVNAERVRGRVEVAPGDRIVIGRHQLRVRSRHVGETALDDAPTAPPEALHTFSSEESEPMPEAQRLEPVPLVEPERDEFDFSPAELAAPAELAGGEEVDEPAATVLLSEEADPAPPPVAPPLHAGLIVQRDGRIERVVAWEGNALTVGRSSDCDLVLGQDEVSRRHARLVRSDDRYEVHDLGSVNGTLVNGRRADRHVLAVGDVITIETFQLTFVLDREPITSAMKPPPAKPTQPAADLGRDTFAMTILQEVLPDSALAPPPASHEATIANVTLEEELLAAPDEGDGLDLPLAFAGEDAIDERKELAEAQPRGSSRAASIQDLGAACDPATTVTLELRLRIDQLPEPLRRAFEEAGAAELVVPADLRLHRS
jgi:pSer/pThr/pTyr-binding forkhead associated (FHA) protein